MSVMSTPDLWSGQDRMLTVEDMENMPDRYEPELAVFELRDAGYELVADVSGGEPFEARLPFPVTVVPSSLVTTAPLA
jgi:hypothetical protein